MMSEAGHSKSIVGTKAYAFALEIIKVYKQLSAETKEYILSKQLLRAGTSIGANVNEAISSESKRDFIHKLGMALKEAREALYWINLLKDSNYITEDIFFKLSHSCNEITRLLSSIILTTKKRYFKNDGNE